MFLPRIENLLSTGLVIWRKPSSTFSPCFAYLYDDLGRLEFGVFRSVGVHCLASLNSPVLQIGTVINVLR